VAVRVPEARR